MNKKTKIMLAGSCLLVLSGCSTQQVAKMAKDTATLPARAAGAAGRAAGETVGGAVGGMVGGSIGRKIGGAVGRTAGDAATGFQR